MLSLVLVLCSLLLDQVNAKDALPGASFQGESLFGNPTALSVEGAPRTARRVDESGCTVLFIGDNFCDDENNNEACDYDGGDCCETTCGIENDDDDDDAFFTCGENGYNCLDPAARCEENGGTVIFLGDKFCDSENNNEACDYDRGDCCETTCGNENDDDDDDDDTFFTCGDNGYNCLDPNATDSVTPSAWTQTAKLVASDGAADDYFGLSVSVSGETIVAGAPGAFGSDSTASDDGGSVYIFEEGGGVWNQTFKHNNEGAYDFLGYAVATSGDTVVGGAPYDDDDGWSSGSAYVFEKSGSAWTQTAKLVASDGAAGGHFAYSVSISDGTIVVGAYGDDDGGYNSGSAYVFTTSDGAWTQTAKLVASDDAPGDYFGQSVSISGDTIVVGAFGDNGTNSSGSAYIFEQSGGVWNQVNKFNDGTNSSGDYLGWAVSAGDSGDTVVIGAWAKENGGSDSGAVWIVEKSGSAWTQTGYLVAPDGAAGDRFGYSVSIDVVGDTIVVGAFGDDDGGYNSGSAYVFTTSGSAWTQSAKLVASDDAARDNFGRSVSISGDTIVVGAHSNDDGGSMSGSAYVFHLSSAPPLYQPSPAPSLYRPSPAPSLYRPSPAPSLYRPSLAPSYRPTPRPTIFPPSDSSPAPSSAPLTDACVDAGGNPSWIRDLWCDAANNNEACDYDGGDCCELTCVDIAEERFYCGINGFDCVDPAGTLMPTRTPLISPPPQPSSAPSISLSSLPTSTPSYGPSSAPRPAQ